MITGNMVKKILPILILLAVGNLDYPQPVSIIIFYLAVYKREGKESLFVKT